MKKYDYIITGAGMGGLSTGNFLTKYGKTVLILEKHDKVGGLCTSFQRMNTQFDCGIESLHELAPDQTISQFFINLLFSWWYASNSKCCIRGI